VGGVPHPSHRIDILLVPDDPELVIRTAVFDELGQRWAKSGWLRKDGPGPNVDGLVPGGFKRMWLDHPGRVVLYANQQGGFRVACPKTGDNIAAAFGLAVKRWRSGGARELECLACAGTHGLEACEMAPPGAFGASAIVLSDAQGISLTQKACAAVHEAIGPFHLVLRRAL